MITKKNSRIKFQSKKKLGDLFPSHVLMEAKEGSNREVNNFIKNICSLGPLIQTSEKNYKIFHLNQLQTWTMPTK